jgi:branched-chain amino acid aminotransferase
MNTFYIAGAFVPEDKATVSANDMSVLRGYGVFDFLRTYNRHPFRLQAHISRLANSARLIDLSLPCSEEDIYNITMETLKRNADLAEANIRIVVTGGISSDSITPEHQSKLLVMVTQLHHFPAEWYRDGVAIITTHNERYLPGAKSIHYIPAILSLSRARQQGAIESIYVDRYGRLLEGTTTNLFAFIGNKLVTPGISILPGITRQTVLELIQNEFQVEIRDILCEEIRLMDEAFITASNKEVVPVIRIDDCILGNGQPGQKTRRIMALFREYTQSSKAD